jgi:hypothetical protein
VKFDLLLALILKEKFSGRSAGPDKKRVSLAVVYQKERDQWEDQDVGGWTILRWILER